MVAGSASDTFSLERQLDELLGKGLRGELVDDSGCSFVRDWDEEDRIVI